MPNFIKNIQEDLKDFKANSVNINKETAPVQWQGITISQKAIDTNKNIASHVAAFMEPWSDALGISKKEMFFKLAKGDIAGLFGQKDDTHKTKFEKFLRAVKDSWWLTIVLPLGLVVGVGLGIILLKLMIKIVGGI